MADPVALGLAFAVEERKDAVAIRVDLGCRTQWRGLAGLEAPWRSGLEEAAGRSHEGAARLQVVHLDDRGTVADGGDGDPEQLAQLDPLGGRLFAQRVVDRALDEVEVRHSVTRVQITLVVADVLAADHRAEIFPLLSGDRAEPDVAVLRRLDRRDLDRSVEGTFHELAAQVAEDREALDHRLEDREVGDLAFARLACRPPRRESRDGGEGAAGPIADAAACRDRAAIRQAAVVDGAGRGLEGEVIRREARPGSFLAPGRQANDRQARVRIEPVLGVEAALLEHGSAPVLEDEVAAFRQAADPGAVLRVARVEDDAPFARVQVLEEGRGLVLPQGLERSRPATHRVARRRLDLDDFGAGVDEELRRVGAGDPRSQIQDADPSEGADGFVAHR